MYKEAHAGNYAMIRTKGDEVVNHALDLRLEREAAWTKKHSTTVQVDKMWQDIQEEKQSEIPQGENTLETTNIPVQIANNASEKANYIRLEHKSKETHFFKAILYNF